MCHSRRLAFCVFLALAAGLMPLADVQARHRCRRARECPCEEATTQLRSQINNLSATAPNISGNLYQPSGAAFTDKVDITFWDSSGTKIGSAGQVTPGTYTLSLTATPPLGTWTPSTQFSIDLIMTIKYLYTPVGGTVQKTLPVTVGGGNTVNHRIHMVLP